MAPWSVPLFGVPMHTPSKNIAMGIALAFGGRQSMKIPNDQLLVEFSFRIDVGKGGTRGLECMGGHILYALVVKLSDTKNDINEIHLAFDGRRLTMVHATTNQKHTSVADYALERRCNWEGNRGFPFGRRL